MSNVDENAYAAAKETVRAALDAVNKAEAQVIAVEATNRDPWIAREALKAAETVYDAAVRSMACSPLYPNYRPWG